MRVTWFLNIKKNFIKHFQKNGSMEHTKLKFACLVFLENISVMFIANSTDKNTGN